MNIVVFVVNLGTGSMLALLGTPHSKVMFHAAFAETVAIQQSIVL
jgi:hypothetical protein